MSLGALAFLNPWLLAGLAALPLIYLLLRTVPPRPTLIPFPALRILLGLEAKQKTPARTPWWLMLIRLLAAALVILALAEPVLNPSTKAALKGSGPVVIAVDNTWAAASHWADRVRMIERFITEAESQIRPVIVLPTATSNRTLSAKIELPAAARSTAAAMVPEPFAPRREAAAQALEDALKSETGASVVWLTDGIDHDGQTRAFVDRLAARAGGGLVVVDGRSGDEAIGLAAQLAADGKLEAIVTRAEGGPRSGRVHAFSARSQRLGDATFQLSQGTLRSAAVFDLPLELRNQVTRVEIAGERSAGAVHLLDARSQWQRVGVITGESREQAQELLAPLHYVTRALAPFAEIVQPPGSNVLANVETVMARNISVLVLADIGVLTGVARTEVETFIQRGGVLVRFAGPRLEKGGDDLIPVPLRLGGRTLGGALSWSTPQPLAPFTDDSLFAGLAVPATESEVLVRRQVLADPARLGAEVKVWAKLKDGTPLVTARKSGAGLIVLFHVTANSDWSNLPLSGLFVEMLRRSAALGKLAGRSASAEPATTVSGTSATAATEAGDAALVLAPSQVLDGFGTLRPPPPTAEAVLASTLAATRPSNVNPPGYYGPPDTPRALNLVEPKTDLKPLPALPAAVERRAYEGQTAVPLKADMLTLALVLLFVDMIAVLLLQGLGQWFGRLAGGAVKGAGTAALAALAIAIGAGMLAVTPADAQQGPAARPPPKRQQAAPPRPAVPLTPSEQLASKATNSVTFGYVVTRDPEADRVSRQGLAGLGRILSLRTALEPGLPAAVDIDSDEIAFFPLLYWPVLRQSQALSEKTLAKIDAYMKQGGMIIFDTKDHGLGRNTGLGGDSPLQRLVGKLDLPRLEQVQEPHVLTRSFYLLRNFPGRWDSGQLWAEADGGDPETRSRQAQKTDGVSSILITSNDFAAAWAMDERDQPLYPVVPGGEPQREQAFRTGVNIAMYALTGNYKSDQVHIPALLERLGQ